MKCPPAPRLSIIVPCFNEEANLIELVGRTRKTLDGDGLTAEILLVDDGSRDRTRALIESLQAESPMVRALYHDENRGIVGGWRTGLAAAHAPYVLTTDADLQYAPEDLPRLFRRLLSGDADVVQGARTDRPLGDTYRRALSATFSFLINRLCGTKLRDVKSGFLCAPREVFQEMVRTRYRYRYPQHFIVVNAVRKGFRVRQEPVVFRERHAGRSFIRSPFWFGLRALADLPWAFWEFRILARPRTKS